MPFETVSRIIELLFSRRVDIVLIPFLTLDRFELQPPYINTNQINSLSTCYNTCCLYLVQIIYDARK